jgi:poly(3-hydroxybutyrate) depolymerase
MPVTRRDFIQSAAALIAASACSPRESSSQLPTDVNEAMLTVKPSSPTQKPTMGLQPLGLSSGSRDGFIYIPPTYTESKPSPLLVMLHGAGQSAKEFTRGSLPEIFDKDRIVVLIPDSRMPTWDMIYTGDYGSADAASIKRKLHSADSPTARRTRFHSASPTRISSAPFWPSHQVLSNLL